MQAGAVVDITQPDGEYDSYGFRSSCMALTKGVGFIWVEGAICHNTDEYRIPLQGLPTGKYRVKINYTLAGYVDSPRTAYDELLGGSGGTQFDIGVRGEVLEKLPDGYYSHVGASF